MANKKKTKTRYVSLNANDQSFVSKLIGFGQSKQDFSDVVLLRNLFSNEKARILYSIKNEKPKSIYDLAKKLGRDLKSVRKDLKVLKRFGFIDFYSSKNGNRKSLVPILSVDSIQIIVNV